MKHAGTAFLIVMLFSTLGLWGCAQQKNGSYASRLRDLEVRYGKLEDEHRAVAALSDRHHRRLVQLEKDLIAQGEELKLVVAERDELKNLITVRTKEREDARAQLKSRTQERDQVTGDLQQFHRDLQTLLGRMETALANPARGPVEVIPASRRSE